MEVKQDRLETFLDAVKHRNPGEAEFHQAVKEVAEKLWPFLAKHPEYRDARILERMTEPDRVMMFRVTWVDDNGQIQVNRGYRVQFNGAIGPYKGGLRFHPSVNLGILKFLAFEQILKNSLTTLPMGGGKGGSDFDPKGKSDNEVMRFCQSFMSELFRHIGKNVDVPAGDIGVGAREVGYLFGQYRRLRNEFTGTLTGKGMEFGGSLIRPEATGYGSVYFAREMLATQAKDIEGHTCLVSGSGNVAQYTVEKLIELGGKVLTMSDSSGFVYDPEGIDREKLEFIMELKNQRRGRISEFAEEYGVEYHEGKRPWHAGGELAFPSATQNEISEEDAEALVDNGCILVSEGANMPTTAEAAKIFEDAQLLFGPGKAANAGGVAISGLEMTQNSMRLQWTREQVDTKLKEIMSNIHETCVEYGRESDDYVDYARGANVGGFVKVANAMLAYGAV
ncbi:MAG: NADP-specific glutamate dehydrogenase [Rhodothermales bacterium]|nr:NADP-specific glutamate dehydrogenase [Rhodothermales bacterium]MBO6781370.1 NADP-specific glutamate dehydrogenase [Rhodothermales bacterium]